MARIAVVGGGLAGLVVALRRVDAGDDVTLLEASPRLGGQLHSERSDDFVVEHGAEGFVARSTAIPNVAEHVGIGDALVDQLVFTSYGFDGATLAPLARGEAARFLGFQVHGDDLGRGIRSFAEGMEQLTRALTRALEARAALRLSSAVRGVEPLSAGVRLHAAASEEPVDVDAAVLATSAAAASRLLEPEFGERARGLGLGQVLSSVTVSLAFRRDDVAHPLDGTGFVVRGDVQEEGFRACTFVSSKLPARAPEGSALLRLFFRPEPSDIRSLSDADWVARAERQLARAVPIRARSTRAWVSRWADALPVFDNAHAERVTALNEALAGRRIWLAGSAFHGSGIDAAVRSAEAVSLALG